MKELTDFAVVNDVVYEKNQNGGYPIVKLAVGTAPAGDKYEMDMEYTVHSFTFPKENDKKLYDQAISDSSNVPVYDAGEPLEEKECGCRRYDIERGESRIITGRKVIAHGPVWVWAAIAVGYGPEGSEYPFLVIEAADTFGEESSDESDMIGFIDGRMHEMTARLVRRAKLYELPLAAMRVAYKYVFIEPKQIGKAKVKEL